MQRSRVVLGLVVWWLALLIHSQLPSNSQSLREPVCQSEHCNVLPDSATPPLGLPKHLPSARVHPLPTSLAKWQDQSGNYWDQVQRTTPEYLVWSQFPIKVYVEPVPNSSTGDRRASSWVKAVLQAVQEWTVYLPLTVVDRPDQADITIQRSQLALQVKPSDQTKPGVSLPRVRSAETRFMLYVKPLPNAPAVLAHRVTVAVRPNQATEYILAATRHELGHALGIWGHSPHQTDTMYFSQVRHPPTISPRDVNTLKRVYEQPTRLGWSIGQEPG